MLRDLFGPRLEPVASREPDRSNFLFVDSAGQRVTLSIDRKRNGVAIFGPEPVAGQIVRLIRIVDAPRSEPGRKMRIVPVRRADPAKVRQAVEAYRKTLEINPRDIQARFKLAEVLASQNRYDESIEEYKAILNRDPKNVESLNNLGVIYFRKKSYEEALRYLLGAVEIDPNLDYIHNNLGMVYAEMGMHEKAREEYEKAIGASEKKSSSP